MNWDKVKKYGGTLRENLVQCFTARHDEESFGRELQIRAFEAWQKTSVNEPRILEKLTRALKEVQ